MISSTDLGDLVASRLQELVPQGFRVEFDGEILRYSSDVTSGYARGGSGSWFLLNLAVDSEKTPFDERVVFACTQALSDLQDYVDETLILPWPGIKTPPRPYAAIKRQSLQMWFSEGETVVIQCNPISLE